MATEICVIIPTSRPEKLPRLLAALGRQIVEGFRFRVVIVSPLTAAQLPFPLPAGVAHVKTERLYPPGKMRNLGAEGAGEEYLAFIDDDCIPAPQWVAGMFAGLQESDQYGAVGSRVVSKGQGFWDRCADYCLFTDYQGRGKRIGPLGSAALLVRRRAFCEAGGFDETLLASEDWELSLRFAQCGWRCVFLPEVEVSHDHGRGSCSAIMKNSFRSGLRSGLVVQQRHPDQISWLAKVSLSFGSPWRYWLLILPYGVAVAIMQALSLFRETRSVAIYFPFMLVSRILYHCGVWRRLQHNPPEVTS